MRIIEDHYIINSNKIKENKNILSIADLHINKFSNKQTMNSFASYIKFLDNINFITISGDLMNSWDYLKTDSYKNLIYFLENLSENKTVILSLGNHDVLLNNEKVITKYKELNNLKNIHALYNESIDINEISVHSFCPTHKAYKKNELFIEQLLEKKFKIQEKKFNILLNHNPQQIADPIVIQKIESLLSQIDYIIAGHMHNGYIPYFIENIFQNIIKDYGFSETSKKLFKTTKLCRGLHNVGDSNMIICKGYRNYAGYKPSFLPHTPSLTLSKIKKL